MTRTVATDVTCAISNNLFKWAHSYLESELIQTTWIVWLKLVNEMALIWFKKEKTLHLINNTDVSYVQFNLTSSL